jgi:hypothetical protein
MLMGKLGGRPIAEPHDAFSAAEAVELLAAYDGTSAPAHRARAFAVPGTAPLPPDEATLALIEFLRQRAAE